MQGRKKNVSSGKGALWKQKQMDRLGCQMNYIKAEIPKEVDDLQCSSEWNLYTYSEMWMFLFYIKSEDHILSGAYDIHMSAKFMLLSEGK
jgi:hypothetical protein